MYAYVVVVVVEAMMCLYVCVSVYVSVRKEERETKHFVLSSRSPYHLHAHDGSAALNIAMLAF